MANIRKLSQDETGNTKLEVKGKTVVATFSVRKDKNSPDRYAVECILDFGGCDANDLMLLATPQCVIDMQRDLRAALKSDLANTLKSGAFAKVDVKKDIIDAARKAADPEAQAVRALVKTGITEDRARAIIAAERKKAA
jgi:hypothetical protein